MRMLRAMHLDHVLDIQSWTQLALTLSFLITMTFGLIWLADVVQLAASPYHVVGCVVFLWNGAESGGMLINYDSGDLYQHKERVLGDLKRQTKDVLDHAKGQADKLTELLSQALAMDLNRLIRGMRAILRDKTLQEPHASATFERLVAGMATHLHELRRPAVEHFKKIVAHLGRDKCPKLRSALSRANHQSMVRLLNVERSAPLPVLLRTLTGMDSDGQASPVQWFGKGAAKVAPAAMTPGGASPTDEEVQNPASIVLQPILEMMGWFSKEFDHKLLEPDAHVEAAGSGESGSCTLRMRLVLGLVFSALYGALTMVEMFWLERSWTIMDVSKVLSLCAMFFYMGATMVVMCDLERLDAVLQMQSVIHKLEDLKWSINQLNAHLFAGTDQSISVITDVKLHMSAKLDLIDNFLYSTRHRDVPLADYDSLAKVFSTSEPPASRASPRAKTTGEGWPLLPV